jgi:hypothetical protein
MGFYIFLATIKRIGIKNKISTEKRKQNFINARSDRK